MNVYRLWCIALVLFVTEATYAEPGLPIQPATAPITLNDTTIAGRSSASDDDYDYTSSQEDSPPLPSQGEPAPPADGEARPEVIYPPTESTQCAGGNCDSGACESCDEACRLVCEPKEPWRLFGCCCCLQRHRINVRGWLAGGYTANFEDPASNFNGPVTFNDRHEAQFNQGYLIVERPIDTKCCGWDLGGRVDVLYGSDYRFTIARGLDAEDDFTASWHSGRFYGLALPQMYGEVGLEELSVKVGHFYTIVGYEVVTAPDNFFYSHAYTMQYGEPFTHTGVLSTWTPNEQLSASVGGTYGWDNFENVYEDVSFLGGVTFTASDGNSKLALAMHIGDEEQTAGTVLPNDQRWIYSIVYSRSLTDRISWVVQHDQGRQDNALGQGATAEWYGLNNYLFYKINCCWSFGARLEWFRDDDGFRVAPAGDFAALGASNNPASAGGFEGDFYGLTVGLNYKPSGNLAIRPELRYDSYNGRQNAAGNDPFDDGNKDHQWLAAFDVIYQY
jgi:hypothetical protein